MIRNLLFYKVYEGKWSRDPLEGGHEKGKGKEQPPTLARDLNIKATRKKKERREASVDIFIR
jgi:hypothetical protein